MYSMENQLKVRMVRSLHSLVQVGAATGVIGDMEQVLNPVERVGSFHSHKTLATDVGKADTKRYRTAKLWTRCVEAVERKDTLRRSVSRGNIPHTHSLEVPQASTSTSGAWAGEPLYFDDEGQPVNTYMVSVPHVNKHLIKFPIALDYSTLRGRNKMEYSTGSTGHSNCSTMLLKADTGADVNLMNRKTFNQLFGEAKVLQLTPIRMENYGNTAVKVLGMFHVFLRWKDKVYKQLFYVTDCDRSPNLLSRDAWYTLGVLKPCFNVENSTNSTESTHASNKDDLASESFLHQKMMVSERKLSNCSIKQSISKSQLQGGPLTKQAILDVYTDIFTRIGKFPQGAQAKCKTHQTCTKESAYTPTRCFP